MTATTSQGPATGRAERFAELSDRCDIAALVDRYTVLLDTQDEDGFDAEWPRDVFAENARLSFPIGDIQGLRDLAAFHYRAKAKFDRTHHQSSNVLTELDGDRAAVRFQMLATHVHPGENGAPGPHFDIGGHYECEAVRTAGGWRFSSVTFHLSWEKGPRPAA